MNTRKFSLILPILLAACASSDDSDDNGGNGGGGGINVGTNATYSLTLQPGAFACADADVLCVDDDAGATQEYATIQAAVNDAGPGDTVLVHDGTYAGFRVNNSGAENNEILITANGNAATVNAPNGASSPDNIYLSDVDYVIIEGFTVVDAPESGIASHDGSPTNPMRGLQVRYNSVSRSGLANVYLSQAADSFVIGNTIFDSVASHGLYLANAGTDDAVVAGNTIYGNDVAGVHMNADASIGGDGLQTGHLLIGNTVYGNGQNGFNGDGVRESAFVNNLLRDNNGRGIRVFRIDANDGGFQLAFVNNTIYGNNGGIKISADDGGHLFFNNIIVDSGVPCISVELNTVVSDNNIFSAGCSFEPNNPALFRGAASQDANAAQLFVDALGDQFDLLPAAPAIGSGVAELNGVDAPDFDILLQDRDASPDIGAYEF